MSKASVLQAADCHHPAAVMRPLLAVQGAPSAEEQAVSQAASSAQGATAYLNMETGDCHGDDAAVRSLIQAGVARVVLGMRHPLRHQRGLGVRALQSAGVDVEVLGEARALASSEDQAAALSACLTVNEVRPWGFGVLLDWCAGLGQGG